MPEFEIVSGRWQAPRSTRGDSALRGARHRGRPRPWRAAWWSPILRAAALATRGVRCGIGKERGGRKRDAVRGSPRGVRFALSSPELHRPGPLSVFAGNGEMSSRFSRGRLESTRGARLRRDQLATGVRCESTPASAGARQTLLRETKEAHARLRTFVKAASVCRSLCCRSRRAASGIQEASESKDEGVHGRPRVCERWLPLNWRSPSRCPKRRSGVTRGG